MSNRTKITIEKHEITVISSGRSGAHPAVTETERREWCPLCQKEVVFLPAENAARAVQISRREIYRRIESAALHFNETNDGVVQVCMTSLCNPIFQKE